MGDAAIRQAQDAAHQAALTKQRASGKATALAEAIRKAAESRELATPQACERPRPLHVPDEALKLAFSEARGDGATWPYSLEEWRKHATPHASTNDIRRLKRIDAWHSWSNEDHIRDAPRFQSLSANDADTGQASLVCAFSLNGTRCDKAG